jgi:hypothetical protein
MQIIEFKEELGVVNRSGEVWGQGSQLETAKLHDLIDLRSRLSDSDLNVTPLPYRVNAPLIRRSIFSSLFHLGIFP